MIKILEKIRDKYRKGKDFLGIFSMTIAIITIVVIAVLLLAIIIVLLSVFVGAYVGWILSLTFLGDWVILGFNVFGIKAEGKLVYIGAMLAFFGFFLNIIGVVVKVGDKVIQKKE